MVQILLATFNSSRFLRDQLISIQAQTYSDWQVLIHDGGSTDATLAIIREFARTDRRIRFAGQARLTAVANFARLWQLAQGDYLMFADHDDLWLPNKIERELMAMQTAEKTNPQSPILVFSDATVVDEDLHCLSASSWAWQGLDPRRVALRQLLMQNVAAGNTIMVNAALRGRCPRIPAAATMHDHWLILVAALFGRIIRLDEPLILYRQHADNLLGAQKLSGPYFVRRLAQGRARAREGGRQCTEQAQALLDEYGEQIPNRRERELLRDFAHLYDHGPWGRRWILFKYRIAKCGFLRNLATWLYV